MNIETLIREIVREEIQLYMERYKTDVELVRDLSKENIEHQKNEISKEGNIHKEDDDIDREIEILEELIRVAEKNDKELGKTYKKEIEKYGDSVGMKDAAKILSVGVNSLRKLIKDSPDIPVAKLGNKFIYPTGRFFYWLSGGKAYWVVPKKRGDEKSD
jgi:hypothetical protein